MGEVVDFVTVAPVPTPAARVAARAAQVRSGFVPAALGLAIVVACLGFDAYTFGAIADPDLLRAWLALTAVTPLAFCIGAVVNLVRRPSDDEVVRVWIPVGRGFRVVLDLAVIVSPWVLLPGAEPALRALMLMLYVWFIAVEVLANDDPQGLTWVACFGVPVSLGLFLLVHHAAYAVPLAGFLALTGGSLFVLRQHIQRNRNRAFEARLVHDAAQAPAPAAAAKAVDAVPPPPPPGFTRRQIEILRLLTQGQSNKDIARTLGISPATVKSHVAQVIAITGTSNRTGASARARDLGLV